jgi:repressor of nif and glnA expression
VVNVGDRQQVILNVLRQNGKPLNSGKIAEALAELGCRVSQRTVRVDLKELDEKGLTLNLGRRGREITDKGLAELNALQTLTRVGFLSARIDQMAYRMSFDLVTRTGTVVVNTTLVRPDDFLSCLDEVCQVFEKGYAMGHWCALLEPGERIGETEIPQGMLGFCTVCSITLNGVLLRHGVPTRSRFGALLEVKDGQPTRFLEMINYEGTSVDPLELFIRSAMTDYVGAVRTNNGCIGSSFREFPSDSRDLVLGLNEKLAAVGLGGLVGIGQPGQPYFDVPVDDGHVGAVIIGGLNPTAILEELGMRVVSRAMSDLLDFNQLISYQDLKARIKK